MVLIGSALMAGPAAQAATAYHSPHGHANHGVVTADGDTAKVVDCSSSDARFKVIGQIDHQSKDASDAHDVCDAYPGTAVQFWYGESGKEGVVWCLALNSP